MNYFKALNALLIGLMVISLNLRHVIALTDEEINAFGARTHIDPNSGVQGYITIEEHDDDNFVVTANGIPDHDAGPFAIPDEFDDIVVQNFEFYIPKSPAPSDAKYELPMGPVGLALNGVALFNPYSIEGTDAVITEEPTFDKCDGHPTPNGIYHYHSSPICVFGEEDGVPSTIIGVALDGYPIYGPNDENGNRLFTEDLDACHGRYVDGNYRYHITDDFPYILGCFNGVVDSRNINPDQVLATVDPDGKAGHVEYCIATIMSALCIAIICSFL